MTERTIARQALQIGNDDTISITSTQESEADEGRSYVVDCILAEQDDGEGNKYYLIRWDGYDLLASTWEPVENIEARATLDEWNEQKLRIARGLADEFDVAAFEEEVERLRLAKEERRKRRKAKRESLGLKACFSEPDEELPLSALRDEGKQRIFEPVIIEKEKGPITNPVERDQGSKSKQLTSNEASETDEEPLINTINARVKGHTINLPTNAHVIYISEDSLGEEADQRDRKRPASVKGSRATAVRLPRDVLNFVSDEESSPSRSASPLKTPRRLTQEIAEDELTSRAVYRGRAGKKVGTVVANPIDHGAPSNRGAARGRPRGRGHGRGANQDRKSKETFSFTALNTDGKTKQRRKSLANALLSAPTIDSTKPVEHFKTPSMVRKAELAARSLADRAPDIQRIGLLSRPSEYGNSRVKKRPQQLQEEFGMNEGNQSLPLFMEVNEEIGPHLENSVNEKLPNTIKTQKSNGPNISQESVTDPQALGPVEFIDTAKKLEASDSNITSNATEIFHLHNGDISAPTEPPSVMASPSNKLSQSLKPITKIKLKEYKSRRKSDFLGDAVSAQITFGNEDTSPTLIGFTDIDQTQKDFLLPILGVVQTLNFNSSCTAQEFHNHSSFLLGKSYATGNVITSAEESNKLEEITEWLRPCFGLLFNHDVFSILIFPARCEEWNFLDSGSSVSYSTRYQIFRAKSSSCTTSQLHDRLSATVIPSIDLKRHYLDSLVELTDNLRYQALLPAHPELPNVYNFFLFFPQKAAYSAKYVTAWLFTCNRDYRIYTNQRSGSWDFFRNNPAFKTGVVIIHDSFVSSIFKIPGLARLINGNSPFSFWCIDDGFTIHPFRSESVIEGAIPFSGARMVRLFPHGGAVLLTPSFLVTQPRRACDVLRWFEKKIRSSTPGTWKLVLPHGCREYLLDIALETAVARKMLYSKSLSRQSRGDLDEVAADQYLSHEDCKARFQNYVMLDHLLNKECMAGLPDYWEEDFLDESESPVIYADDCIDRDDEKALIIWFAGWAMLHLDLFRKFIVIGTTPRNKRVKVPTAQTALREMHLQKGSTVTAIENPQISRTSSPSATTTGRWNRDAFPEVKEAGFSILDPNTEATETRDPNCRRSMSLQGNELMDLDENEANLSLHSEGQNVDQNEAERVLRESLQGSRSRHGIDESQPPTVLEFIAITGTEAETAQQYLSRHNGDIRTALKSYRLSSGQLSSQQRLSQMDGAGDLEDPAAVVDFITGSDSSTRAAERYFHTAQDDVKRAIALYNDSKWESRSPSGGLPTHDTLGEKEVIGEEGLSGTGANRLQKSNQAVSTARKPQESSERMGDDANHGPRNSGIITNEAGTRQFVPRSVRPLGTIRQEIIIRPGYIPTEDIWLYENSKSIGGVPECEVEDMRDTSGISGNSSDDQLSTIPKPRLRTLSFTETDKSMSAISCRYRLNPDIESTVEWYEKLRKNGKGWEHIYVGGWESCFPRFMSSKK